MDGWYPKVRIGGRRERVPVLVTLGVRASGERVVLDLRLVGDESAASWSDVVTSLTARHLRRPVLAVVDGNPGLTAALRSQWPAIHRGRQRHVASPGYVQDRICCPTSSIRVQRLSSCASPDRTRSPANSNTKGPHVAIIG
jgi:hypothetical protein